MYQDYEPGSILGACIVVAIIIAVISAPITGTLLLAVLILATAVVKTYWYIVLPLLLAIIVWRKLATRRKAAH